MCFCVGTGGWSGGCGDLALMDLELVVGVVAMVALVRVALALRLCPGDEYEHFV